jgi:hypothetical protein
MTWSGPSAEQFDAVRRGFLQLNDLGTSFGFGVLFPQVTPKSPNGAYAELDFIRMISWLYAHWHEVGRVSANLLYQATGVFNAEACEFLLEHFGVVASLRTLLHHDLSGDIERGGNTQSRCEAWFSVACGEPEPNSIASWSRCLLALCDEARLVLEEINRTLQRLSADASAPDWLDRWRLGRERQLNDGELDHRIKVLARQMGVEALRVPEFRRRYRAGWSDQVRLCPVSEISSTLDRAIANDLLTYSKRQHPLRPIEVIQHLGLAEGPLVGEAMRLARQLHDAESCPKDELLRRLAQHFLDSIEQRS